LQPPCSGNGTGAGARLKRIHDSSDGSDVGWPVRVLVIAIAALLLGAGAGLRTFGQADAERRRGIERELEKQVSREAAQKLVQTGHTVAGGFVPTGLLGSGMALLAFALWPRRGGRRSPSAAPADANGGGEIAQLSRKDLKAALRTAKEVEAQKGPEAAAELLLGHGLRDDAFSKFMAASNLIRAAEIRHDQNRFQEAADLYERAQRPEAAGAIYARLERPGDAARCYQAAGKWSVAGELFEKTGNFAEAGRCYREIGFHRHAAQAFLEAGDDEEAARSLKATFDEEGGGATGENAQKEKDLRSIARKGAQLFAKLGRLDEAETLLVRAGLPGPAAQVAMKAGAYERAADLFLRTGRGDLASEALERAGDAKGAARHRGDFLRNKGEDAEAAHWLEEAGDYQDAGDLYRKIDEIEKAGSCYFEAQDYGSAAEMFLAVQLPERAGEAFERANDLARAAECFSEAGNRAREAELQERAGDIFAAGKAYAALERVDDAIRLLQSVEPSDARYAEACALLGALFEQKGMHSLSIQKLEQAVGGDELGRSNVEAFYNLACANERRGEFEAAVAEYERILGFDYQYQDVAERLARAKEQLRSAPATPAASPGGESRYEIRHELGRGGMGVVYLARDTVLDREVAYKVLPEGLRANEEALKNFLREAKAAAQLNHPNIVTVYDAGESEHGFYLAMERVEGTTLKDILQRRGPLSPTGVLYVLRQMTDALAYAHSRKVVHRDIKTANTMWTKDKQVKIMDFGLAKLMEEVRNATTLISGTPFYMSPEQTLGRNIDHRTDLYSLGVTLFELVTGDLPFRKGNVPYHHVHTAPPDPREIRADVPEALTRLILRCLEKDPANRFQSAQDLRTEADAVAAKGESTPSDPTAGKA
jgi:tetratricopeptide (TPR) repeat protein